MGEAWLTHFEGTWLNSAPACHALDEKIAKIIGDHWKRRGPSVTPANMLSLRCKDAASLLRDAGISPGNAIHCTIMLSLIGELLLCAEQGGIFREDTVARFACNDELRTVNAEAMRRLRNAVCHPAAVAEGDGEIAILALASYVERYYREETWGPSLRSEPGRLADRLVAFFALRLVNNLGWWQAEHWRVTLSGAKRPWPARR